MSRLFNNRNDVCKHFVVQLRKKADWGFVMAKNEKPLKESFIGFRITMELRERVDKIHRTYGTRMTTIAGNLIEAWCDLVEHEGRVRLPLRVEVDEERVELKVAEEQTPYHPSKSTAALPLKAKRRDAS
jgi:hypothetical protein